MRYNFLFMSLLTLLPGAFVYILRPDLRKIIHIMALLSIPFAFTERLFYPDYWEPVFLFDLVNKIGFGVEDLLFVMGLGAFASTVYAAIFNKTYLQGSAPELSGVWKRVIGLAGLMALLVLCLALLSIPMIYGSALIMLVVCGGVVLLRNDLLSPALLGGAATLLIYTVLCWISLLVYPQIFELTWHTERFTNVFILGIPVEELIYAFTAGLLATVAYPFVFDARFVTRGD